MTILKLLKRNFGHVYLNNGESDKFYRFRARRGYVAFIWPTLIGSIPFRCRLSRDGKVVNMHDRSMSGYGKQYGKWTWRYFLPMGFAPENVSYGGYWL